MSKGQAAFVRRTTRATLSGSLLRVTPTSDPGHRRTAYLAWIAVCVLWGTTYLGIRIALETIPPALVGGLRYTAAGTLLIGILSARGEGMISPSQWRGMALIGLLTICIGNGGVIWAEQWVPSGIAAVTVATVPFWMIAIEAFTRDADPLSTRLVFGLLRRLRRDLAACVAGHRGGQRRWPPVPA